MTRLVNAPAPGFFVLRLVRGGPLVPARIWRPCVCTPVGGDDQVEHEWTQACDRYPELVGEINGRRVDVFRVWHAGRETTREDYEFRLHTLKPWAEGAGAPEATPDEPVDLNKLPALW